MASSSGDTVWMGRFSLLLLLVQNYSQFLLMKMSRENAADQYSTGAAVLFQEIVKLVMSLGLVLWLECGMSFSTAVTTLRQNFVEQPMELLKIAVPGLVYTLQNSLMYIAVTYLDAPIVQVLYQAKILTTAIFSVAMLGRVLSSMQWGCLVLLTAGVALVQLNNIEADAAARAASEGIDFEAGDASVGIPDTPEGVGEDATRAAIEARQEAMAGIASIGGEAADDGGATDGSATSGMSRQWVGFFAVMAATTLSGFAGVYFEKVLKGGKTGLWMRNVQLAAFGIIFGTCGILFRPEELRMVTERGLLSGFTPMVWAVVLDISVGGLAVAMVVKYASSVEKGFSISMSVLLSALTAAFRRGGVPSAKFALGTALVLAATVGFSHFQPSSSSDGGDDTGGGAGAGAGTKSEGGGSDGRREGASVQELAGIGRFVGRRRGAGGDDQEDKDEDEEGGNRDGDGDIEGDRSRSRGAGDEDEDERMRLLGGHPRGLTETKEDGLEGKADR